MTREQVRDKVIELTRSLSLEELEDLMRELFEHREGDVKLTDGQLAELDAARAEIERGEGIVVDDIDAFFADCEAPTD